MTDLGKSPIMSAAAADGAGGSAADEPSSSAASAANGGDQPESGPFSAVPATLMPAIAQCLTSYADLCAFRRVDKTRRDAITAAVLIPILQRLLEVLLASLGLGGFLVCMVPQLPLPEALSHGCCTAYLIEQLTRRLFMLERGGDWARWRPVLAMLYFLRGERPVVLSDDNFGVINSRAAFVSETEAVRQWKILSRGVTVDLNGQQEKLMKGDSILRPYDGRYAPALLTSASPVFPHPFDPADPPTQLTGCVYPNYTSMVAFKLFEWLRHGGHLPCIRHWLSYCRASAASRRVCELLAVPPSDVAQRGAGAGVFDEKWPWSGRDGHHRLVVLGSGAMGDGHMAVIQLEFLQQSPGCVIIYTTESAPHDQARTVVMRVLRDHLGRKVWRGEIEWRQASANTRRCTVM
ncbi:unnamed protein product [Vitrella brassicaformis CCMP3155]|uniref:Uncharacterized protein n=1 Tax=Vitrella brassicaformis (strain CCMP3155) TaxID=1169540 RepID=A0A0G4EZD8_VITBC|nr:unnamed protein product [Vitrella brassicaformis CCMP3155]|eukprot:CEM04363.1 unnamed protein product [Vitrella brassicaformis CCMP3155]